MCMDTCPRPPTTTTSPNPLLHFHNGIRLGGCGPFVPPRGGWLSHVSLRDEIPRVQLHKGAAEERVRKRTWLPKDRVEDDMEGEDQRVQDNQERGRVLTTDTGPLDRGQKQKILEAEDEEVKNVHMKDHAYSRMQEKNLSAQANVHPRTTKEFHSKMVNREKF